MLFFNDPLAIELAYVIPLRIVSSNDVDSILQGKLRNQIPDPDYRIASQWEITPKKISPCLLSNLSIHIMDIIFIAE